MILLRSFPRINIISFSLLLLSVISSFLILHNLHDLQLRIENSLSNEDKGGKEEKNKGKIAWIDGHGKDIQSGYMRHIFEAFTNIGYDIITGCPPPSNEWDVLWLHEYALSPTQCHYQYVQKAKWPQIVNHVPGSGYYTSKVHLATANLSMGVPLAFKLPQQAEALKEYAKENPTVLWVQKDNSHRNIRIRNIEEIQFDKGNSFVQKFVDDPLLIDNRKFDIGIYTVVTSLDPLRVYTYNDVLIRFCPKDYHPFDENDVDKYVVGDDYTPIWEMPSLVELYQKGRMNTKQVIEEHLQKEGKTAKRIWEQIEKIIAEVFQSQQSKMINSRSFKRTDPKLFELSRFDFVVDDQLNVYLMEANMSPNLSSGHFKENQILYEQVLFSILSLVGLANPLSKEAQNDMRRRPRNEFPPVTDRDMSVRLKECSTRECGECKREECSLCGHCISQDEDLSDMLGEVVREGLEKRKMTRLRVEKTAKEPLTRMDRLLVKWMKAKCYDDHNWC